VAKFKYLGTALTDQNYINEEIKSRINSGNACYHSVQGLLPSRLLSRNVKVKIYKTIILPDVFYGCETWSLILSEEHKLRVFENRVLRRIFGQKCALINSFHTNKLNGVCNDRQSSHKFTQHIAWPDYIRIYVYTLVQSPAVQTALTYGIRPSYRYAPNSIADISCSSVATRHTGPGSRITT
jgi:hypothetical protein